MVHIKRLELTNFKSFGGTSVIPVLPEFTVVTGPNGSGKSNILDALLFCLGISTSKGMRAERLPDLVNHNQANRGRSTVEASVTVTFDLGEAIAQLSVSPGKNVENGAAENEQVPSDNEQLAADSPQVANQELTADSEPQSAQKALESAETGENEWSITRRLRVTKQGTYTSTYYMNGTACTLTELHEQLNLLRIYPEGYNVVLQGDVTSIISMNARERREIIDELAGVAAFDRKIVQAKEKLDEVKEREDRCRIVEQELITQRDRLASDRSKAEKYQKLRTELQEKEQLEAVLKWRQLKQQEWHLREHIETGDRTASHLANQIATLSGEIQQASTLLEELNNRVKALGEEELIALQSTLATQDAEQRQHALRKQELEAAQQQAASHISQNEKEVKFHQQTREQLTLEQLTCEKQLQSLKKSRDEAQEMLTQRREQGSAIAAAAEEWVQQQTTLHRQIETLQKIIDPQRTEQARLAERTGQLKQKIQEQQASLQTLEPELATKQANLGELEMRHTASIQQVQSLAQNLAAAEEELQTQQETQKRLLEEQREKQRRLDKLEAQAQALQETSGTGASKVILQTGLPGVCGIVAQLGRVEPHYQLALETAAGARLGFLVVEDDGVAAAGIELLKQKRAGRATFLPLNKIKPPRFTPVDPSLRGAAGFIDYAVHLIDCDKRYLQVFAFVFGNTIVFETVNQARPYLGQARIVTLSGELLEPTGAMSGGSTPYGQTLHFGTGAGSESTEVVALQDRLHQIEQILQRCTTVIEQTAPEVKRRSEDLIEAKQQQRELQLKSEQLHKEIKSLTDQIQQLQQQGVKNTQELATAQDLLHRLETELPAQEGQLNQWRQELVALEASQSNSEWLRIQTQQRELEATVQEWEQSLRSAENRQQDLANQHQRSVEKIQDCQHRLEDYRRQESRLTTQNLELANQLAAIAAEIAATKAALAQLEEKLGEEKQARDRAETHLRERHLARQQVEWQLQKLQETQHGRREQLGMLQEQLQAMLAELPDPQPPVPVEAENRLVGFLQELQKEVRSLQQRLKAMEPVNMLALEEYDRTQTRLQELQSKLATLEGERTELLLRIENFTTLRLRAFKEAFDAVNQNFQSIFAELSDGDGYLHLDDPQDPFTSGLNLVAHPKGKPVQRLASMSGGEKSLTALSFIFSLQRYRPSPFYAFDEVDMFLDGANVDRLAKIIKQQSHQAQFIVVSHKTPMIKAAERIIGVTQARGAYTQVVGINLQPQSASV